MMLLKDQKTLKLAISLAALAVLLSLLMTAYSFYRTVEARTIPMRLAVDDALGFSADADSLNLGTAPPGSTLEKRVEVSAGMDAYAEIRVSGNISRFISYEKQVHIPENKKVEMVFTARIPDDAERGKEYCGEASIIIRRS